jgi:hypothetical protein
VVHDGFSFVGERGQLAEQVDVMPSALPVPWKPNSVVCPAATVPL